MVKFKVLVEQFVADQVQDNSYLIEEGENWVRKSLVLGKFTARPLGQQVASILRTMRIKKLRNKKKNN